MSEFSQLLDAMAEMKQKLARQQLEIRDLREHLTLLTEQMCSQQQNQQPQPAKPEAA